jgi:hypothetical protein
MFKQHVTNRVVRPCEKTPLILAAHQGWDSQPPRDDGGEMDAAEEVGGEPIIAVARRGESFSRQNMRSIEQRPFARHRVLPHQPRD